jgi:hypothetical protein
MPCARGSRIPCPGRGIHRGMRGVLREEIWCSSTPISLFFAAVLWLGTTLLDPLKDLTHGVDPNFVTLCEA